MCTNDEVVVLVLAVGLFRVVVTVLLLLLGILILLAVLVDCLAVLD